MDRRKLLAVTAEAEELIRSAVAQLTPEQQAEIDALRDRAFKTRRATVPALDDLLFLPLPVLDRGFIRIVDYMGDDAAIVQAARVSYGAGTKKKRDDAGLIKYLMRHRHTSPFEMCELKLHAKMPIFVARQWIRHRTACLSGDTRLYFDLPNGIRRGRRARLNVPLAKLFRMWHEGSSHELGKRKPTYVDQVNADRWYSVPELAKLTDRRQEDLRNLIRLGSLTAEKRATTDPRLPSLFIRGSDWHEWAAKRYVAHVELKGRLKRMNLRMCDEDTGEIRHTRITDVWSTGTRPVYRVTLNNDYSLKMTKDHRCLTRSGWMTLEQATGLRLRVGGAVTWNASPDFAVNGVPAHQDPEWLRQQRDEGLDVTQIAARAGVSYHTVRKALQRHGLQFSPKEKARLSGRVQRGQRRTLTKKRVFTEEWLRNIRHARSGERSNFWKGGITSERAAIGAWTVANAQRVHERNGFQCVICGSRERLNAHHVDPVWNAPQKGRELDNLTSLCRRCHRDVHRFNLELALCADLAAGLAAADFWFRHPRARVSPPAGRRRGRPTRLQRAWSGIKSIEYIGEEPTFDLAVDGPFHNFVANGFVVHNSVNEYSARYSILDREFYVPEPDQIGAQSTSNRQGRGEQVSTEQAQRILDILRADAEHAYNDYEDLLNEDGRRDGPSLARELARMNLPVNFYTQWYWKIDLHNLLHFLQLRADPHAQYEIRVYAEKLLEIVKLWVPLAYDAFMDYRMGAAELSAKGLAVVQRMIRGEKVEQADSGMSPGEWRELMEILER